LGRLGDWVFYIGPKSSRGDIVELAGSVGAAMVGHDRFISLPVPRPDGSDFDSYLPAWMLVVGPDGRRLCDETSPYGITCGLLTEAGGRVFGFFDEGILAENGEPGLPTFKPHPSGALRPVAFWTSDSIRRCIEGGNILRSQSLEELFSRLDLPVVATAGAVRRYNESAALGEDRDFGKEPRFVRPIAQPPFYGVELRADRRVGSGARRESGADRGTVRGRRMHRWDSWIAIPEQWEQPRQLLRVRPSRRSIRGEARVGRGEPTTGVGTDTWSLTGPGILGRLIPLEPFGARCRR
jgi:hypothetical protein